MPIDRDLRRALDACADSHRRLIAHVDEWAAGRGDPTVPSRLPGWTVGHVLAHLARNADSLVGMISAADRGAVADQYPSREAREGDIAAGAGRSAVDLAADVRESIERLETAWEASPLEGEGRGLIAGLMPVREFPRRRQREVEIHHVDLGLGYEPEDWPAEFVRLELRRQEMTAKSRIPMGFSWGDPVLRQLSEARRLAWLVGRHTAADLPEVGPFA